MNSPCNWPVDYTACQNTTTLESADAEVKRKAEVMATSLLWRWTGRVFGLCPATVRPCREYSSPVRMTGESVHYSSVVGASRAPWTPVLIDGKWFNITDCGCTGGCGCGNGPREDRLMLPPEVHDVLEVRIEGEVLDPSNYHLTYDNYLVRDDDGVWPQYQDVHARSGAAGTWEINVEYGVPVPEDGRLAAGILANEFAKSLCGDSACALPRRTRSVTRQGISMDMGIELMEDVIRGRTGITQVDGWVASVMNSPVRPRVTSPDFMQSAKGGLYRVR